jgi:hypothetical protein
MLLVGNQGPFGFFGSSRLEISRVERHIQTRQTSADINPSVGKVSEDLFGTAQGTERVQVSAIFSIVQTFEEKRHECLVKAFRLEQNQEFFDTHSISLSRHLLLYLFGPEDSCLRWLPADEYVWLFSFTC